MIFLARTSVAVWRIAWTIRCPDLFLAFWIAYKADLLSHKIIAVMCAPFTTLVH